MQAVPCGIAGGVCCYIVGSCIVCTYNVDKEITLKIIIVLITISIFLFPSLLLSFCFEEAGAEYGISPQLLWAIAKKESGFKPHAINYNSNGSFDFGLMQINSSWYDKLGHDRWMMLGDACFNVKTGAWVLAQCISRYGNTWDAVGCYNSSKKSTRIRYANSIYGILVKAGVIRSNP